MQQFEKDWNIKKKSIKITAASNCANAGDRLVVVSFVCIAISQDSNCSSNGI